MTTSNVKKAQPDDIFIDCASTLTPSVVQAARSAGVKGFMKYDRYDAVNRPKYWTEQERDTVLELGGYIMSNWEIQSDRALQGYLVGKSDGKRSRDWLRSFGYPEKVSCPVSVDMNTFSSNFYAVHDFCRGYWETDGDECDAIGYLDTDGGRALADICDGIWIPGAFGWSPELLALNTALKAQGLSQAQRNARIADAASKNPQAIAIQFPSTTAFGISVDFNRVLKPFNVWCAPYTISPPKPLPPLEDDMAIIIMESQSDPKEFYAVFFAECDSQGRSIEVQWSGDGNDPRVQERLATMDANFGPRRNVLLAGLKNNRLHPKHKPSDINDSLHMWTEEDFAP